MFIISISCRGVVTIDVLPEKITITNTYYCKLVLAGVVRSIEAQRPKTKTSPLILHHDHAPCQSTQLVKILKEKKSTVMPQPLYSLDLATLDFWVFLKLKSNMSEIKFTRTQGLTKAVRQQLETYGDDWCCSALLRNRREECKSA